MHNNDIVRNIHTLLVELSDDCGDSVRYSLNFRACTHYESWMWGSVEDTYTPGGKVPTVIAHLAVLFEAIRVLGSDYPIPSQDMMDEAAIYECLQNYAEKIRGATQPEISHA